MFDDIQLADLQIGLPETLDASRALKERCVLHAFTHPDATIHAHHGLARRLDMLCRCVERVYESLPPDQLEVPDRQAVEEATAHIQAFVMNAFGACDNLAWLWVLERGVTQPNGNPLLPKQIGLGERYARVRQSLTPLLLGLLVARRDWFDHLTDFRDALAHRIPLYIPPFMVDPADGDQYAQLDAAAGQALHGGDLAAYEALSAERDALRHFKPLMTHALDPTAKLVVFHVQLLADLATINELAAAFLDEL